MKPRSQNSKAPSHYKSQTPKQLFNYAQDKVCIGSFIYLYLDIFLKLIAL
jgi:hypothetical protein